MASPAIDFARNNQQRFLSELKDLLRIPSVSTLENHKPDVKKAAEYVANELRRFGMENVEIIPTKGHPLIYADWLHATGKPRSCAMRIMTFSRPNRSMSGIRRPSSPRSETTTSTRAERSMTKASFGWK